MGHEGQSCTYTTWHAFLYLVQDLLYLQPDTGEVQVVTNSPGVPPRYGTPVHLAPSPGWSHTSRPLPTFGAPGDLLFFKKNSMETRVFITGKSVGQCTLRFLT